MVALVVVHELHIVVVHEALKVLTPLALPPEVLILQVHLLEVAHLLTIVAAPEVVVLLIVVVVLVDQGVVIVPLHLLLAPAVGPEAQEVVAVEGNQFI